MERPINVLINSKVINASSDEYGVNFINFDVGSMAINNPIRFLNANNLSDIVNKIVVAINENEKEKKIQFFFSDNIILEIDLSDEVYEDPEAIVLHLKDGKIVVYN